MCNDLSKEDSCRYCDDTGLVKKEAICVYCKGRGMLCSKCDGTPVKEGFCTCKYGIHLELEGEYGEIQNRRSLCCDARIIWKIEADHVIEACSECYTEFE